MVEGSFSDADDSFASSLQSPQQPVYSWLVFSVHDAVYAVDSAVVREVMRDLTVYPLPFVPPYLSGLINRHGEPYAVIDLAVLLGGEPQQTPLFLVLNGDDTKSCFRVTQILEFHDGGENVLNRIADSPEVRFFSGTVEYERARIPVFDSVAIMEKIRTDLENS